MKVMVLRYCYVVVLPVIICGLLLSSNVFALRLPDTGQSTCYEALSPNGEIPCGNTGQDGAYNINPRSYTIIGAGSDMVLDNNTGLIWQRQDDGYAYNWYQASGTVNGTYNPSGGSVCGSLTLGGYSDWRLPSKKELITLVDYSISSPGPTINWVFTGTQPSYYWSSTPYVYGLNSAWMVGFDFGPPSGWGKSNVDSVRCVRGGQSAISYTDNHDGTVTDTRTGLIWQQQDDGVMRSWGDAITYCEGLNNPGGYSDWRLPNILELESITDDAYYRIPAIAIDPIFTATKESFYWASTTIAMTPPAESAWQVSFFEGYAIGLLKDLHGYARCVRGGLFYYQLNITPNGTGTGTVTTNPSGINCGSACSAFFPANTVVNFQAISALGSALGGSIFSGWGGDAGCATGQMTMNGNKNCTATFSLSTADIARIGGTTRKTITEAYALAPIGTPVTIQLVSYTVAEPLNFSDNKDITLIGGFDGGYTPQPSSYTASGSLSITGGSVATDRFVIRY
ncbi:MAG: DUF1566 domain-containing protein [Thermodesulfovibrionales bacterium]